MGLTLVLFDNQLNWEMNKVSKIFGEYNPQVNKDIIEIQMHHKILKTINMLRR